ncbi:MAG TPA: MATE family efflux transporter [Steroidobacter sp.]|uniref:MATE family efflux transporter n=1 Tax=Steroidobacter sp. TaxID=1978227 RepID=UPI002EDA97AA
MIKDFTKDSIPLHLLSMALPLAANMFSQIAYQLVNLYFLTKIGVAATAGANAASNMVFAVTALAQVLGVGTTACVAHVLGRKDAVAANELLNQSVLFSGLCGFTVLVLLMLSIGPYLNGVAADQATIEAGTTFILWVAPGYALMLPWTAVASALRGAGVVKPIIAITMLSVVMNVILAPILIVGWLTGIALGVRGAGLATSISVAAGTAALAIYVLRPGQPLRLAIALMRPKVSHWRRILAIGIPAGGEFALTFASAAVVYYCVRDFGASAQAGFGIGSRVLQAILLPGLAIALAAGPIVGQNFGARNSARIHETIRTAVLLGTIVMMAITALVQWYTDAFLKIFSADSSSAAVATLFLQLTSWTFVAQGLVYTCTTTFQGLGNTVPALLSSATRFCVFAALVLWLSTQPHFRIEHVWYASILSVALQAIVSLSLLRIELRRLRPQGA